MMKILVTGASGFIGSNLVPILKKAHDVNVLDARQVTTQNSEWREQVDQCDVLIHLAGRAHVSTKSADSSIYKKINTDLTTKLAEQLALNNKHMVFISTAVVYGQNSKPNQSFQIDTTLISDSPYAASKVAAENAIVKISQQSSLSYTVIRPPLVYGPGVKANFLSMIKWVQAGVPLPLGSARNLRSLVGVRNLSDLIQACATNPAAKNQVFNASDDHDISTTDLLTKIAISMNKKSRLIRVPLGLLKIGSQVIGKPRAYDGLCGSFQLDLANTKQRLGWTPPFSLEEEIATTVAWFEDQK
jgi:nucleoside-diphosphate-sugar epimerase